MPPSWHPEDNDEINTLLGAVAMHPSVRDCYWGDRHPSNDPAYVCFWGSTTVGGAPPSGDQRARLRKVVVDTLSQSDLLSGDQLYTKGVPGWADKSKEQRKAWVSDKLQELEKQDCQSSAWGFDTSSTIAIGTVIEKSSGRTGTVQRVNGDGTYTVEYDDDHSVDANVRSPRKRLAAVAEPSAGGSRSKYRVFKAPCLFLREALNAARAQFIPRLRDEFVQATGIYGTRRDGAHDEAGAKANADVWLESARSKYGPANKTHWYYQFGSPAGAGTVATYTPALVKKAIREALRSSDKVDPAAAEEAERREFRDRDGARRSVVSPDHDRGQIVNLRLLHEERPRDVHRSDQALCGEGTDHHTEYPVEVTVCTTRSGEENHLPVYRVYRRYKQFRRVQEKLKERKKQAEARTRDDRVAQTPTAANTQAADDAQVAEVDVAKCDKKRFFKFNQGNIKDRTKKLGKFLQECSDETLEGHQDRDVLRNSAAMRQFARIDLWQQTQKLRSFRAPQDFAMQQRAARTVLRFMQAIVKRDSQVERIQRLVTLKNMQFATILMQGIEVLKFSRLPASNPRARVLWLHPDGVLCLGRREKQPRHTTKCIRLEHMGTIQMGAKAEAFSQSPRFIDEIVQPDAKAQCISIYSSGPGESPAEFHFRMPTQRSAKMLEQKLLDVQAEISRAQGPAAQRAQAVHYARNGKFLPERTTAKITELCTDSGAELREIEHALTKLAASRPDADDDMVVAGGYA